MAALVWGIPFVLVPHGVYESGVVREQRDFCGIRRAAEVWVVRRAAAIHVFYRGECDVVNRFAGRIRHFIVVPNGAPRMNPDARWVGDGDYFLWIGRFDPFHKGLDHLVQFWRELPVPRPRLVLAGPDFMGGKQHVRELIRAADVEASVEVIGRVTGVEKSKLMASARAYLHPSRWESCSIMLLEALAAGLPSLVSSTIHAAHELEPRGVLSAATFTSAGSTAQALELVDRSRSLSERASTWAASSGSWEAQADAYLSCLRAIVCGASVGGKGETA